MWQDINQEIIFDGISLQLEKGTVDENDMNLLLLCIKRLLSVPSALTENERQWCKMFCGTILIEWRPLIDKIDCFNKTKIEKMVMDMMKMTITIEEIFAHVLNQVTNLLSALYKSINMEIEKCSEESLISKMRDTFHLLLILCDSFKQHSKDRFFESTTALSLVSDILLMEWLSEKDFVLLNQVFSTFLDLSRLNDQQVKLNYKLIIPI